MFHHAVIGCGFGDEGKGRVTSHLCSHLDGVSLVIRYSGGHQAGHHVITNDGTSHIFSNFGCGSFENIPTYWSEYCTVDPTGILNELEVLKNKGVTPTLYINEKSPVTTPWDKIVNIKLDEINKHGSCGLGFGQTFQREEDRYSLLFEDLYNYTALKIKTDLIRRSYYKDYLASPELIDDFLHKCSRIVNMSDIIKVGSIPGYTKMAESYIFEGSQGLLLDQDIGFFPHVSRTNCSTKNILKMGFKSVIVHLVTRAYQTRHGNGPMTNVDIPHNIKENPFEQNSSENFQGEFRRSILDLDLLKYGIYKDPMIRKSMKVLYITCLDLLEGEYKLTQGNIVIEFNNEADFINKIRNHLNISEVRLSRAPTGKMEKFE